MTATAVKERPILFSSPMVRAILDGRKTMTRRIIKDNWWRCLDPEDAYDRQTASLMSRYGQPGERLWVRETFRETNDIDGRNVLQYMAGGTRLIVEDSDGLRVEHGEHRSTSILPKWKPSIFMPRWASRITLEIVNVWIERVQDISEANAQAEGFEQTEFMLARRRFELLWGEINGKESWEANPWVWCVSFKRINA